MNRFSERYQQGFYQEVYDELLAMGEQVFDDDIYEDAFSVGCEMMRRVRYNIEQVLIPRLKLMDYRFGDGSWDHPDNMSDEELLLLQQEEPVFQAPTSNTSELLVTLEKMVGIIPLSLKCWYEEVGAVNLIGAFHSSQPLKTKMHRYKRGYGLDPLYTQPLLDVVEEIRDFGHEDDDQRTEMVPISPDGDFKYGYSGGGDYEMEISCKAFDGLLLGEPHKTTFVNYLRICFHWGGLPGLEKNCPLSPQELNELTKDLLPF